LEDEGFLLRLEIEGGPLLRLENEGGVLLKVDVCTVDVDWVVVDSFDCDAVGDGTVGEGGASSQRRISTSRANSNSVFLVVRSVNLTQHRFIFESHPVHHRSY